MLNRRAFLQSALLGGAAFGLGLKLGLGGGQAGDRSQLVLHGFLPADGEAVGEAVRAFLAATPGQLPAPVLDVTPRLRGEVAAALRGRAGDFVRGDGRVLSLRVTDLGADLATAAGADILVQDGGRVLDPAGEFGRGLLALRAALQGRTAAVALTARLEARDEPTGRGRVLVVEDERGLQERIALAGAPRSLELGGPAGRTQVEFGQDGVRVVRASCRHATCRLQGTATRAGDLIACAPNRLLLRVESA
ncbi:hypothetical protein FJ250_04750 [bacterium]|nr:hypothetical protein [bacterium]